MLYRILLIILFLSALSGQSLFDRWVGSDPFMGSPRSTAMGNTHLLNSTGSTNVRFNPANLGNINTKLGFDIQVNRSSVFERWSMPVRDSFGEFLTHADYVANEFSYYGISGGIVSSLKIPVLGTARVGFHYAPLTHFAYQYSEEVRGSYRIEDGEYASKDPIVGYQNLSTDGTLMAVSIGAGVNFDFIDDIEISLGGSINLIQTADLTDRVEVDTLYSDVTNLTTLPDWNATSELPATNFITLSTSFALNSNIIIGASWEGEARSNSSSYYLEIDSTS